MRVFRKTSIQTHELKGYHNVTLQGLIGRELKICSKTDVRIVADHLSLNIKYKGKGLTKGRVNNLRPNLYKTFFKTCYKEENHI